MAAPALHHLAFRTRELERLARFYREVVGLAARSGGTPGRSIWLALGEAIVMIETAEAHEPAVPEGTMELVAFRVAPEERAGVRERLERAGVPLEAETAFTIYARDPDGRRVAFSHYPEAPTQPTAAR